MTRIAAWNDRVDAWLRARVLALTGLVAVLGLLPLVLGLTGPGYLVATLCAAGLAALLAGLLPAADRRVFVALVLVATIARLVVHPLVFAWTSAAGGPFLGPDSTKYFEESVALAADDFWTYLHPALYFGTYDSAHYYVFAALVRLVGPDLYALQWWNCCLTAVAAATTYPLARRVDGAPAALAGLVVALHPSFVVLGAKDLLKDPAVVLAALVTVWSWLVLMRVSASRGVAAFAVTSTLAMSYLRMSRPYALYFLEFALAATLALAWWRGHRLFGRRAAALGFAAALLVAEIGPWAIGWPPSPAMLLSQFRHTAASIEMREYSRGLFDTFATTDTPAAAGSGSPSAAAAGEVLAEEPDPLPTTLTGRLVRMAANGVRKTFGPFVWIKPPGWDAKTMTTDEFLLYPGMLLWYALLPALVLALATTARRVLAGGALDVPSLLLAMYVGGLGALYLAINLSYRQRDFLFPFAAVLSLALAPYVSTRVWARVYLVYWLALGGLAAAHLTLKALLT